MADSSHRPVSDESREKAQGSPTHVKSVSGRLLRASDIARLDNGAALPPKGLGGVGTIRLMLGEAAVEQARRADAMPIRRKVILSVVILVILFFFSLGVMGAGGAYYPYSEAYDIYGPDQVIYALWMRIYNLFGQMTSLYVPKSNEWLLENVPGYWAVFQRLGVVIITLVCAILLSTAGMLYQMAFRNPLAGPGMLGVSSGSSVAMVILVALYGGTAASMVTDRYVLTYSIGATILIFVLWAGRKLSGKGRPLDIMSMILIGMMLSQLLGFVTEYVTLFVMDDTEYAMYFDLVQMLIVDTSYVSWISLALAFAIGFLPVFFMRRSMNCLGMPEAEARVLGVEPRRIRMVALVCGALMLLAASVHTGVVALVSLLVPFLSRQWFGREFTRQLAGCVCIGC
ncbi:MAG: iron ABC transporter permease, partial [Eggerthellaceae bacterium]|nr:iron ABC transporter permease [Eggerthellaceae bacterium]